MNETFLKTYSLGWELEANMAAINSYPDIEVDRDASVNGDGREYRLAAPVVKQPAEAMERLRRLVADPRLSTDRSCGFHVHVGLQKATDERRIKDWAGWAITLARFTEREVFTLVPQSRRNNTYCKQLQSNYTTPLKSTEWSTRKGDNAMRYSWLNPVEAFRPRGIRTIEFRLMGDSKQYVRLLGWAAFCVWFAGKAYDLMGDPSGLAAAIEKVRNACHNYSAAQLSGEEFFADFVHRYAKQAGLIKSVVSGFPTMERRFFDALHSNLKIIRVRTPAGRFLGTAVETVEGCLCYDCISNRNYRESMIAGARAAVVAE